MVDFGAGRLFGHIYSNSNREFSINQGSINEPGEELEERVKKRVAVAAKAGSRKLAGINELMNK